MTVTSELPPFPLVFPHELAAIDVLLPSLQTSDRDERMICYIVNTAEYCHQTVSQLFLKYYGSLV
jgi:hypothetical protein